MKIWIILSIAFSFGAATFFGLNAVITKSTLSAVLAGFFILAGLIKIGLEIKRYCG